MSAHRFRRVDRRTAEQLLRGAPDPTRAGGPDALSDLLAAASAPARDSELAGEQVAVAAFRAARLADAPQPRRESMLKVTLAKLLTVKIAAALAAVTVGGVAVAAATGNLPTQREDSPATSSTSTVASTGDQQTKSPSAGSEGKPGGPDKNTATDKNNGNKPNGDKDNNGSGGNGSPSPSLVGLCHAFTAGAGADHGKALENPAFTFLITTAGGKDKVPAYCADLLAKEPKKPTGKPATNPNGPGEQHPPGKANGTPPSTHPGH